MIWLIQPMWSLQLIIKQVVVACCPVILAASPGSAIEVAPGATPSSVSVTFRPEDGCHLVAGAGYEARSLWCFDGAEPSSFDPNLLALGCSFSAEKVQRISPSWYSPKEARWNMVTWWTGRPWRSDLRPTPMLASLAVSCFVLLVAGRVHLWLAGCSSAWLCIIILYISMWCFPLQWVYWKVNIRPRPRFIESLCCLQTIR